MSFTSRLANFLPILLLILGVWWRLLWLDSIPFSFYHDELDYAVLGQSVASFGADLGGAWTPWSLMPAQTLNTTAEITPAIHGFFSWVFYDSILWSRVPATVFGLASLVAVWFLVRVLTSRPQAAWWASAALAISPWHIFISRSGFEGGIAVFFLLSFVLCLVVLFVRTIRLSSYQYGLVLAGLAVSFLMGFFSYHAAKFVLLSLALVGLVMAPWLNLTKIRKIGATAVLIFLITTGVGWSFWQMEQGALGGRQGDLVISQDNLIREVDEARRLSLDLGFGSAALSKVFNNKAALAAEAVIDQYLSVFDLYRLFVSGYEGGFQFSLIVYSYFFLSGLVAIPAGVVWLVGRRAQLGRPALIFLLLALAVSPVASAITASTQSIFRAGLTYALLVGLAGLGYYALVEWLGSLKITSTARNLLLAFGGLILIGQSAHFAYAYFSQYPFRAVDNHDFAYRLMSEYLERHLRQADFLSTHELNQPIEVFVERDPWSAARAFLGYAGLVPALSESERLAMSDPGSDRIELDGIVFATGCPDFENPNLALVHGDGLANCDFEGYLATAAASLRSPNLGLDLDQDDQSSATTLTLKALASPLDSRSYYWILNDQICQSLELPSFISAQQLSQFQLNRLSTDQFCQTWVKTEAKHF